MIRSETYRQFEHKDLEIISNTVNTPRVGFWFGFLFNFRRKATNSNKLVSSTTYSNILSNMQFIIVLLIAIVASASAFAPRSFARASSVKAMVRLTMSQLQVRATSKILISWSSTKSHHVKLTINKQTMKQESSPLKSLVIPAAVLPFLAPMAAFAAEGTGRVSLLKECISPGFWNLPWTTSLIIVSYVIRLSASTMADWSGLRYSLLSSSSRCTSSGQASRRPTISSTATRRDVKAKLALL